MLSVKLEYFIIKYRIQNSINIQLGRNQAFTDDNGFLRSYIRFTPTIMIRTQQAFLGLQLAISVTIFHLPRRLRIVTLKTSSGRLEDMS